MCRVTEEEMLSLCKHGFLWVISVCLRSHDQLQLCCGPSKDPKRCECMWYLSCAPYCELDCHTPPQMSAPVNRRVIKYARERLLSVLKNLSLPKMCKQHHVCHFVPTAPLLLCFRVHVRSPRPRLSQCDVWTTEQRNHHCIYRHFPALRQIVLRKLRAFWPLFDLFVYFFAFILHLYRYTLMRIAHFMKAKYCACAC